MLLQVVFTLLAWTKDAVEHCSGLGAFLKWGGTPHFLPYPYLLYLPDPYPMNWIMVRGDAGSWSEALRPAGLSGLLALEVLLATYFSGHLFSCHLCSGHLFSGHL